MDQMKRAASSFGHWYARMLDTHPIRTKAATSGLIAGAGDCLCQYAVIRTQQQQDNNNNTTKLTFSSWDKIRTARFVFLGAVIVAPIIHYWYGAMAQLWPSTAAKSVLKRVGADQFVFTPIYVPFWLTSLWILEDKTNDISQRLQSAVPTILMANWGYWIPVQYINFMFLPLKYQVLFSNVAALFWNAFMSFVTNPPLSADMERKSGGLTIEERNEVPVV